MRLLRYRTVSRSAVFILGCISVVAIAGEAVATQTLRLGQALQGRITDTRRRVEYRLHIAETGVYDIRADKSGSSQIDPKVTIYHNREVIATNDNYYETVNARIIMELAGRRTYRVVVESSGRTTGAYWVTAHRREEEETRVLSTEDLGPVLVNQTRSSEIDPGETHEYTFHSTTEQDAAIIVTPVAGSSLQPHIVLIRDGQQVADVFLSGGNPDAVIQRHMQPGHFTIQISGITNTSGAYELRIDAPQRRIEHTLGVRSRRAGRLARYEEHYYRLQVENTAKTVEIGTRLNRRSGLDPRLTISTESGEVLVQDDNDGEGRNAKITTRLNPGWYIVAVASVGETSGSYSIYTTEVEDRQGGMISLNEIRTGMLGPGEAHEYRFRTTEFSSVEIIVEQAGAFTLDPIIELQNARSERLTEDDNGAGGQNAKLALVYVKGLYKVIVRGVGGTSGDYRIRVRQLGVDRRGPLRVNTPVTASLEADIYHRYNFYSRGVGKVVLRGVAAAGDTELDLKIFVTNADGTRIIGNDDNSGGGLNPLLVTSVPKGRCHVYIYGRNATTGSYTLNMQRSD